MLPFIIADSGSNCAQRINVKLPNTEMVYVIYPNIFQKRL